MRAVMTFMKSFMALFVLVLLLLQLVPGKKMKHYIQFFAQTILTLGLFFPLVSWLFDSDVFLQKIQYESFTESLTELSKDTGKLEFLQNDYYLEQYEIAVGEDVRQTAIQYVEEYGLNVSTVKVTLTSQYTIESMKLTLKEQTNQIVIDEITWKEDKAAGGENGREAVCEQLIQELSVDYQVPEDVIYVNVTA